MKPTAAVCTCLDSHTISDRTTVALPAMENITIDDTQPVYTAIQRRFFRIK
jgi:hypothetical protein